MVQDLKWQRVWIDCHLYLQFLSSIGIDCNLYKTLNYLNVLGELQVS